MLITINLHSSIYHNSILDDILSPIACLVLRQQCHVVLLLNIIYRIEIETRLDLKLCKFLRDCQSGICIINCQCLLCCELIWCSISSPAVSILPGQPLSKETCRLCCALCSVVEVRKVAALVIIHCCYSKVNHRAP